MQIGGEVHFLFWRRLEARGGCGFGCCFVPNVVPALRATNVEHACLPCVACSVCGVLAYCSVLWALQQQIMLVPRRRMSVYSATQNNTSCAPTFDVCMLPFFFFYPVTRGWCSQGFLELCHRFYWFVRLRHRGVGCGWFVGLLGEWVRVLRVLPVYCCVRKNCRGERD